MTVRSCASCFQSGYWLFAHAYVRGDWRREATHGLSALLDKSCHDFDLIDFWTDGAPCLRVSSFGSLKHFTSRSKVGGSRTIGENACILVGLLRILHVLYMS